MATVQQLIDKAPINSPSFTGTVTLNGALLFSSGTIVAAGTTQATATAITKDVNIVTSGTGGIVLPVAVAGRNINIANNLGVAINVYPAVSGYIDALAVNIPISLPAGSQLTLYGISATNWESSLYLAIDWNKVINKSTTVAGYGIGAANTFTGNQTAPVFISNVTTGTAPLTVASTTKVTNLNADLLDDKNSDTAASATTIAARDASGNLTANGFVTGKFTMQYNATTSTMDFIYTP